MEVPEPLVASSFGNTLNGWNMSMSSIESFIAAAVAKFGAVKLMSMGVALIGALFMMLFRPPKTRKEVLYHALVAASGSLIFGGFFSQLALSWLPDDFTLSQVAMPVHFLVGALSWGGMGAVATYRDKLASTPKEAIQDVKDLV